VSRFRGTYIYSIDSKGRINIPSKFRKALSPEASETFVVCRAPDNSLRAYPKDAWDRYEDELAVRPETPEAVKHSRLLRSTLSESTLDKQGRIKLDGKQIAMAGIIKNVILIGYLGYIEIWGSERYTEYIGTAAEDFDTVFYQSVEAGLRGK
jgi:MraZ protein